MHGAPQEDDVQCCRVGDVSLWSRAGRRDVRPESDPVKSVESLGVRAVRPMAQLLSRISTIDGTTILDAFVPSFRIGTRALCSPIPLV